MSRSVEDKSANGAINADREEIEEKFDISSLEIAAPPFCWGENLMSGVSFGVLYPNCIINESEIVKKYQCEFCDYKTSYKGSLKKHIVKLHETKQPFKCMECDFVAVNNQFSMLGRVLLRNFSSRARKICS